MKKIIICGGHLTPALALIEQLTKEDVEIIFIGRKHSIEGSKVFSTEYEKIRGLGIKFLPLTTGRLQRKLTIHTVPSIAKVPIGFFQSFIYLLLNRPHVVVSFGGYLSTPVVICAWLLGITAVTHEQSTKVGIANKINSLFTKEFFTTWEQSEFTHAEVIGNPTRLSIYQKNAKDKRLREFLKTTKKIIYITGGNLGSHQINKIIFENIDKFRDFSIVHQIGIANYKGDHALASKIKNNNYIALPYIGDEDIGAVLNSAYIVISRSGANTVWELALLGKVSVLIPLPIAGAREQEHNAKVLEKAGSSIVLNQNNLNHQILMSAIVKLDKNYAQYQNNADNFSHKLKKNAASVLKKRIIKYL